MKRLNKLLLISTSCLSGFIGFSSIFAQVDNSKGEDAELIAHRGGGGHGHHEHGHAHFHGHHNHHHWHHNHHNAWFHHRHYPHGLHQHWHHHGYPWHHHWHDWYWYGEGVNGNPGYYYDPSFYYEENGLPSIEYEYDVPEQPRENVLKIQNKTQVNTLLEEDQKDKHSYENDYEEPDNEEEKPPMKPIKTQLAPLSHGEHD